MINWKKYPFMRILIPFVFGIIFSLKISYLDSSHLAIALLILLGSLIFLSRKKKSIQYNYLFGIILNFTLFVAGFLIVSYQVSNNKMFAEADYYRCDIIEPVKEKSNTNQLIITISHEFSDSNWEVSNGKAVVYLQKDSLSSNLKLGDCLLIKGKLNDLEGPKNPNEFDYRKYLHNRSIYKRGYLKSEDWLLIGEDKSSLYVYSNDARKHLLSLLKTNGVKGDQFAIASALILGSKDELDFEVKKSYATAGAMHVLAVSGLHVGIVYLILNTLLSFLNKFKKGKILKAGVLIFCLWGYALLTGLSPSVLRAATMFSFIIIGIALNRKSSIYNTLAASAFFLLIINPKLIFEVGFQLSYIAVLGIVYLQPLIYKRVSTKWWLLDKIWAITAVSIAAQIATLPLTLYYFNQFSVYFMLSNLIVIPAAVVILGLGILLFVTSPLPVVSESIGWLLNKFIGGLNYGVKGIENLPNSLIEGVSISMLECIGLYVIIVLFVIGLKRYKLRIINFAIILTILFVGNDLWEDYKLKNTKSIVVYHINKEQAIDFIDGNSNTLLTTPSLIDDIRKQSFHIKSHWANRDLNDVKYISSESVDIDTSLMREKLQLLGSYSQFYNEKIVCIDNTFDILNLETKIEVIYVLIANNSKTKLKDLYQMFAFEAVIVDGSNSQWNRNRVVAEAKELHISVFNTDEGAFSVEL